MVMHNFCNELKSDLYSNNTPTRGDSGRGLSLLSSLLFFFNPIVFLLWRHFNLY